MVHEEIEIKRSEVQSQPQGKRSQDPILKNPSHKRGDGVME
jgi:hypothetical protein